MSQIKTLIFDVGMVLADFAWKNYLEELYADPKTVAVLGEHVFTSKLWDERDVGLCTEEEYIRRFKEQTPGYEAEIEKIFREIHRAVVEYPYAADWLKSIKAQGYQILLLSNYADVGFAYVEQHFQFMQYVDGGVISARVQKAKPDFAIYQILMDRYQLVPEECIFIDDRAVNLEPAKALGIHTILATSHEAVVTTLKEQWGIEEGEM